MHRSRYGFVDILKLSYDDVEIVFLWVHHCRVVVIFVHRSRYRFVDILKLSYDDVEIVFRRKKKLKKTNKQRF